jgi:3-oxoacyl-[acyl-carrier protein] reductase
MNLDLTGKTALVCGSTQGIGLASAVELALLGANVTLVARNEDKLTEVIKQLDRTRGQLHRYLVADFSDSNQVKQAIENYLTVYPDVHILINNTGGPAAGPLIDAEPEQLTHTFQMHVINNQLLTQAVVPAMKKASYGRIVNVISTSVKQPIPGLGVSNTIRAAVANWSKTLSIELGPFGITVNNVLPGSTRTARLSSILESQAKEQGNSPEALAAAMEAEVPIRRFSEAAEVAAAVAFLCCPAAASITGINLPVDGGKTGNL